MLTSIAVTNSAAAAINPTVRGERAANARIDGRSRRPAVAARSRCAAVGVRSRRALTGVRSRCPPLEGRSRCAGVDTRCRWAARRFGAPGADGSLYVVAGPAAPRGSAGGSAAGTGA